MLGDDAGSPILAAVTTTESVLNRVAAGTTAATALPPGTPLEAFIEREAVRPSTPDIEYRQSADAGLYFLRLLRAGNVGQLAPLYVTQYGIAAPTAAQQASLDAPALALAAIVSNRVPDGARLAADLRAAQPGLPATPAIPAADKAAVQTAANAYLAWYDSLYDAPTTGPSPSWVDARMEYQFSVDASATDTPCAFVADRYTGEPLDWPSFDHSATPLGAISTPPAAVTRTLIPAPVTFKGMPAPRYWQLEDASVDIGAVDAGPADTARLMLREFALIYGNDWFVVPIPVTVGAVAHVTSLVVTDTFGITQTIPHYSATPDGGRWRMFAISGDAIDYRLILPPVLARGLDSQPQEQVLLVRDDAASMAWGVEKIVAGASGTPIDRASAAAIAAPTATATNAGHGAPLPTRHVGTSLLHPLRRQRRQRRSTAHAARRSFGCRRHPCADHAARPHPRVQHSRVRGRVHPRRRAHRPTLSPRAVDRRINAPVASAAEDDGCGSRVQWVAVRSGHTGINSTLAEPPDALRLVSPSEKRLRCPRWPSRCSSPSARPDGCAQAETGLAFAHGANTTMADYTWRIATELIELAPQYIVSRPTTCCRRARLC